MSINDNKTEGKAKDIRGKVKEEAGNLTGNEDLKRKGQADQVEGKVQKGVGDAEEEIKK